FRALQLLGVKEFQFSLLADGLPPYLISIIENSHRVNLNPIEQAESYQECMRRENMTVAQLTEYTGKPLDEIYRVLRYLKLVPEVRELIRKNPEKFTRGKIQHFAQFKQWGDQITLAQRLIAGEDPPELIEAAFPQSTPRGDAGVIARLPATPEGLIRRML